MLLSIEIREIRRNGYFQSNFIDLFVYFLLLTFALSFNFATIGNLSLTVQYLCYLRDNIPRGGQKILLKPLGGSAHPFT